MKHTFYIIISSLFLFLPLESLTKETGILYLWEIYNNKVWKKVGDDKVHQKYN